MLPGTGSMPAIGKEMTQVNPGNLTSFSSQKNSWNLNMSFCSLLAAIKLVKHNGSLSQNNKGKKATPELSPLIMDSKKLHTSSIIYCFRIKNFGQDGGY